MKRIIMLFIRCAFFLPGWIIKSLRYTHSAKKSVEEKYNLARKIALKILSKSRVKLTILGQENIPSKDGFVFYPNHQGLFDTFVMFNAMDRPFSVIIKKEMRNVFLLKNVLDLIEAVAIDRENIRQSMTVITKMIKDVSNGRNYIIYPEGTRSHDGNKIHTFKSGSFKASLKTKTPIVPVALIDCFKPFDEKSIKKLNVYAYFLKPLYYDEYKDMNTTQIATEVANRIQNCIDTHIEQFNTDSNNNITT